jgi:hypothetical protein
MTSRRAKVVRRLLAVTAPLMVGLLTWSPAAAALNYTVGGGAVTGGVVFNQGYVPVIGSANCVTDAWTFNSDANATSVLFNVNGSQYAGHIGITVQGNSCATPSLEDGPITLLSASGSNNPLGIGTMTASCNLIAGNNNIYIRLGTHVIVLVNTNCYVNAWAAPNTTFVATGEFIPTSGDGVNWPITAASFDGAFTVFPS